MDNNANALNWFEISVNDMDRAIAFYENVFQCSLFRQEMMGMDMAFFPADGMNGKVGGGLAKSPMHIPSADGALIYLNANPSLDTVLDRVASAGGKVIMPKTKISDEIGYMAFFTDTEGNKVGLHSGQ